MKPKKLDRFERDVEKVMRGRGLNKFACKDDVVALLRKQHQEVVDLVQEDIRAARKVVTLTDVTSDLHVQAMGEWRGLRELLDKLKRRAT